MLCFNADFILIDPQISRSDQSPANFSHVHAFSTALQLRKRLDPAQEGSERIAFERFALESFVYHTSNSSIFYSALEQPTEAKDLVRKFAACFSFAGSSISGFRDSDLDSPLLGCHPDVFLCLTDAIKTIRSGENDTCSTNVPLQTYLGLSKLEATCLTKGLIYIHAARIALLCLHEFQGERTLGVKTQIVQTLQDAILHIEADSLQVPFSKYYLIPLGIIGSVVTNRSDQAMLQSKFDVLLSRNECRLIKLVSSCMYSTWVFGLSAAISENKSLLLSKFLEQLDITAPSWWQQYDH